MDEQTSEKVSVGVIGVSGYGGSQLVRLLVDHPRVEIAYLGDEQNAGKQLADIYPYLAGQIDFRLEPIALAAIAECCQVVFLALPDGIAHTLVPTLLGQQCQIVDLSADYRFHDLNTYRAWYGSDRQDHDLANQAAYGLPELFRNHITTAQLVACPGYFATASLLGAAPLLKQGLAQPESIIIDAKAGASGGGRTAKDHLLMAEADNSLAPYSVIRHRHTPEIEQVFSQLARQEVLVQFTPHLVPMVRGILATIYATMRDPGLVRDDLTTIYSAFYRNSPWITVLPNGVYPQTKWAWGTNRCYIGVEVDPRTGRVIVMTAIDNLMKGQAAQAVQCFNLMQGFEETLGLPQLSFYP